MNSITQNKKNICFYNIIGTARLRKNKKVGAPHVSFPLRAAGVDSTGVGGRRVSMSKSITYSSSQGSS